jgi:uracil-DNA glycosylase family 4
VNLAASLDRDIIACERCPRLRHYCLEVARLKRRAYRGEEYWGKPVPSFGSIGARLLIIGLAPGAHGANRTGRVFTGDRSGDFLYRALHRTGFASQAESRSRNDGLLLRNARISAAVRCAPPGNRPSRGEIAACRAFLERELDLMPALRAVVCLGRIAFDTYLSILKDRGIIASRAPFLFAHGAEYRVATGAPLLIASYHPSQQNTSTGRLTPPMLEAVFRRARRVVGPA